MAKGNGKSAEPDVLQAVMVLTSEVAAMRADMADLPEKTAGRAVELLFEQLRGLNQKDWLALKFASAVGNGAHTEVP